MKKRMVRLKRRAGTGLQIVLVGALTGVFAGVIVTLYNLLATLAEEFSRGYYGFFRENPGFIPLLFLALLLGSVVIGGVLRLLPVIRGSGIPQTEGAMRGLMRFSWYRMLTGMFAASLFCIFMGLAAGAEGPSLLIGSACGHGTNDLLRRNALVRRYQITGGACAGLAVAFNAPLTGMAFAFEEGHKRFTPEVFVCAFSSVVFALLARTLLRAAFGFDTGAYFDTFFFPAGLPAPVFYGYVLLAAVVCALAGVVFYYLVFAAKRLFARFTLCKGMAKLAVPFLLAGAAGLLTAGAMGGGHAFISALGSRSESGIALFSSPLWAALLVIVLLRLAVTIANMGAGVPCGAFIPMLSLGAGVGALLCLACRKMGMDDAYADALIVICMAVFFTTVVKAPITGIVMTLELTWNFMYLLPVVIGAAVGYLIGDIFRTKPIYERLLDEMLCETPVPVEMFSARFLLKEGTVAAGRDVRDVLWPAGVRITHARRGGETFVPDGNCRLLPGDILTAEGRTCDAEELSQTLAEMIGERVLPETFSSETQ